MRKLFLFLKKHKSMKKIALFIIAIFTTSIISAQTASVTIGCDPLEVDFTSPSLSTYFWRFGDGNVSEVKDPSHNYTAPGVYTVELFEGTGGPKIGEIEITVLSPPDVQISANETMGCSPFQVQFTNESIIDPKAEIIGYFWTFGDGESSSQENPTHIYSMEGVYPVSLKIISALDNCTTTESFDDFITVSGNVQAGFSIDNSVICEAPATFNITNNTVDMTGYTYAWDFGNGQTSTDYNPPAANYTDEGSYLITMMVDNGEGCVVTLSRLVSVGKPQINLSIPDTVCIDQTYAFLNNSEGNAFSWSFGSGAMPQTSQDRNPLVTFTEGGPQIVTFSSIASTNCTADTFFTVFVDDPRAAFTIDPIIQCFDPSTYVFEHPRTDLKRYDWYIEQLDISLTGGPSQTFIYDEPNRDSFYISRLDTFKVFLEIETNAGCTALDSLEFFHRAPRAHFVPNTSRGCAPLTVNFDEVSESVENIISWDWVFGDGQSNSTTTPDDMQHTYTEPGEYYVQLWIENEVGCKDTSEGVWIYVGEPIDSDYTFDQTEICLNESVNFEALNLDPRIDAWHFDTDGSRISDCYTTPDASHTFIHEPGTFPVSLTIEYNGCYNTINTGETITVNGSKSRIKFMTNCIDPYTVMFQDSSLNATTSIWYINGDTINMDTITGDVFNYTFDSTGDYTVKLWTDDDSMCDPDSSTVNVYIRDIQANFDFPDKVCASTPIELDASASIDVDETCSKGYEWFGIAIRPRQVDYPVVQAAWAPGPITVRLVVEDLNGCKDTLEKQSEAFEVRAGFEPSRDMMCFPSEISFEDLSTGDTTLMDWNWSFGSMDQNPTDVEFLANTSGQDSVLSVELIVKDVLGCVDSLTIEIPVYEVVSNISFNPGTIVCLGETINLSASDFTAGGSFLNFDWDLGPYGTSMDQSTSIVVTESGETPILLTVVEDTTGCTNQYPLTIRGIIPPTAEFTVDLQGQEVLCPNEQVSFINESFLDGPGGYVWDFGNNTSGFGENPVAFFDDGTYDIVLTVNSIYGCSDTYTQQVTLQGPNGDFTIDREFLCLGDVVTFTLGELTDVVTYEWDFGDGVTLSDQNPVEHPYTFLPDTLAGTIGVSLILESENGCKRSIDKTLNLSDLVAAFGIIKDTVNLCNKEIQFIDSSEGGVDTYLWEFGDGETSTEQNPVHTYTESGLYNITLKIQSNDEICESTAVDTFTHTALNKVQVPTVFSPNNDDTNDFFDIIIREDQRECVEVIKSKIFNRWGNLIYDNNLPPEGWNGRYDNGDEAPAEVYTYVLEVVYSTGETEFFKGTFTLIK